MGIALLGHLILPPESTSSFYAIPLFALCQRAKMRLRKGPAEAGQ
jgi:hypothetical protein